MTNRSVHIALNLTHYDPSIELGISSHVRFIADLKNDPIGNGLAMKAYGLPVIFSLAAGQEVPEGRERLTTLIRAASHFDAVELDANRDLHPVVLDAIPPRQRIITWRGPSLPYHGLLAVLSHLSQAPARYYVIIAECQKSQDALIPLRLQAETGRRDLVAFATGALGRWTRIASPYLGAPIVYADPDPSPAGAPTPATWKQDYGLPSIRKVNRVFGIAGNPVYRSLSPRLHNQSYIHSQIPCLYLPFCISEYKDFWRMISGAEFPQATGWSVEGITTVSPFKEEAFRSVSLTQDPFVEESQACNLVLLRDEVWVADSTDGYGVITTLDELFVEAEGMKAAVIGCGGAGRTIAARLKNRGVKVELVNRSRERGDMASRQLGLPFIPLENFSASGYQLIVHATPKGKDDQELLFDLDQVDTGALLIDLTYAKGLTPMVKRARDLGIRTIEGKEILVFQVRQQYFRMTGVEMPEELACRYAGLMKVKVSDVNAV